MIYVTKWPARFSVKNTRSQPRDRHFASKACSVHASPNAKQMYFNAATHPSMVCCNCSPRGARLHDFCRGGRVNIFDHTCMHDTMQVSLECPEWGSCLAPPFEQCRTSFVYETIRSAKTRYIETAAALEAAQSDRQDEAEKCFYDKSNAEDRRIPRRDAHA